MSTVENHDDIAAIKASGFSSKKAANGKVKVPDKFQSSASRLCGIFELNVKQRKAFLNFAEARGNKTKAGHMLADALMPRAARCITARHGVWKVARRVETRGDRSSQNRPKTPTIRPRGAERRGLHFGPTHARTQEQMIKAGAVSPGTAVLSVGVGAGFGTLGCQAGGLGSSASLSTDNDDERLELCNEMGVLGRKVAADLEDAAEASGIARKALKSGSSLFLNATGPCRGHSRSSKINDTLPFALRSHVWLVARFIWILLHHDTHKQLEAGFVENVPAFFGTPPCDLIISQLKKKGYNVLVHVRVPMTQLKIPSLRERTILRFWRAAPGETPKVTVRKRLVVS